MIRVFVVSYLPPPPEGTAKITEVIIKSEYLEKKFKIEFLPLFKRSLASYRGKFSLLNVVYNVTNFFHYFLKIIRFNPDIIYLPLAQNRLGFLRDSIFILLGKLFRKKICAHFHGGNFDLFCRQQSKNFQKYIGCVLKRVDRLILLAEKFKKQFSSFISIKKMSVLYNCVPEIPNMTKGDEKFFTENKIFKILFIGYLSKAKGALDLVKSIPIVISEYKKPIEFILCGQPVDIERNITFIPEPHFGYTKMTNLIRQNKLQDYVRIYTVLTPQEKHDLFLNADIFVFPTYSEGCGLVVLEAMAYGLPVITTPVGALEEMLAEEVNCYFVKPGDYENLAKKILFLLENPQLIRKMGENNKKLIEERYNPDTFIRNLANIWNSKNLW